MVGQFRTTIIDRKVGLTGRQKKNAHGARGYHKSPTILQQPVDRNSVDARKPLSKMLASGRERGVEVVIVARNTDQGGEGGKMTERSTELDTGRKNIQRGEGKK